MKALHCIYVGSHLWSNQKQHLWRPSLSNDVHPVLRPDGPRPEPLPRPDGPASHRQLRPTLGVRQLLRLLLLLWRLRRLRLLLGEHGPADNGGHGEDCGESRHCS